MGITALGPRKKIINAIDQLRNGRTPDVIRLTTSTKVRAEENKKLHAPGNKLITEFFQVPVSDRTKSSRPLALHHGLEGSISESRRRKVPPRAQIHGGKFQDIPPWCVITGTPFRVVLFYPSFFIYFSSFAFGIYTLLASMLS